MIGTAELCWIGSSSMGMELISSIVGSGGCVWLLIPVGLLSTG